MLAGSILNICMSIEVSRFDSAQSACPLTSGIQDTLLSLCKLLVTRHKITDKEENYRQGIE